MTQALHQQGQHDTVSTFETVGAATQLALYDELYDRQPLKAPLAAPGRGVARRNHPVLCAGCRAREARYGFRPEGVDAPAFDRPRALCFDCFRVELTRRQLVRERMARGWNAHQVVLPLEDTLKALDKRRRRAQIAARRALDAAPEVARNA